MNCNNTFKLNSSLIFFQIGCPLMNCNNTFELKSSSVFTIKFLFIGDVYVVSERNWNSVSGRIRNAGRRSRLGDSAPSFTGLKGFTRLNGFTGLKGFTGFTGLKGFKGFTGFTGFTGLKGFKGFILKSEWTAHLNATNKHKQKLAFKTLNWIF